MPAKYFDFAYGSVLKSPNRQLDCRLLNILEVDLLTSLGQNLAYQYYIWFNQITFDYIEFIPKILGSQEVPCSHVHNLASKSSSISNFLSNYLVTPVLLNHPAVEPVGHVEYMFSPPDNKLH